MLPKVIGVGPATITVPLFPTPTAGSEPPSTSLPTVRRPRLQHQRSVNQLLGLGADDGPSVHSRSWARQTRQASRASGRRRTASAPEMLTGLTIAGKPLKGPGTISPDAPARTNSSAPALAPPENAISFDKDRSNLGKAPSASWENALQTRQAKRRPNSYMVDISGTSLERMDTGIKRETILPILSHPSEPTYADSQTNKISNTPTLGYTRPERSPINAKRPRTSARNASLYLGRAAAFQPAGYNRPAALVNRGQLPDMSEAIRPLEPRLANSVPIWTTSKSPETGRPAPKMSPQIVVPAAADLNVVSVEEDEESIIRETSILFTNGKGMSTIGVL